jgi:hypothetical protein
VKLDTGGAWRCVGYAIAFLALGGILTWSGMAWAGVLSFGFAADAVRRAPAAA